MTNRKMLESKQIGAVLYFCRLQIMATANHDAATNLTRQLSDDMRAHVRWVSRVTFKLRPCLLGMPCTILDFASPTTR